jgi:hypothetical protein
MILFLYHGLFPHLYLRDLCPLSRRGHLFVHPGLYSCSVGLVVDL